MLSLYEATKNLMIKNGNRNVDLANHLNVTPQTFGNWVMRKTIPDKYSREIATFFNISLECLYNPNSKPVKNVPIVGISSCGVPNISDMQEAEGYVIFSGDDYTDKLYCVVANGDSMSPDISDGDIVFCDPTAKVLNGDMVHYTLNNESAIKVYFKNEATQILELVPRNQIDGFKTSYIKLDDGSDIDIIRISKVVEVHHKETNNRLARLKAVGRA